MNNKLGMNLLLWGVEMNDEVLSMLDIIKDTGYDAVEIPIMNLDPKHWEKWSRRLEELQLSCIVETINGPDHNSIHADANHRKGALEFNKGVIECANVLGADLFIGPIHSALGVFTGSAASKEELSWAKDNLWALSEYAGNNGVTIGLEYLNRFESYLVSCTDETLDLIKEVNHPSCKMMFDTFHANIEEKDLAEAVQKIGDLLVHVQLSENDRGTLGQGHVDFPPVIEALKSIDYHGMISVEAFSQKLSAAHIWRQMFESEVQLTRDSFVFLEGLVLGRGIRD